MPFGELEMARTSASTRIGGYQPPNTLTFNPPHPLFFGCDAQVSMLIDKESHYWIEDAMDNNFVSLEARLIKASYRFLVDDKQVPAGNPLLPSHPKSIWRGLWKLKVPNRTKTLLWHAISNALPTRLNLVKRKVLTEATCQLCGLDQ